MTNAVESSSSESASSETLAPSPTELLQLFLTDRDTPCPQCGYNLRSLRDERCPECGETLVLRVNVAEPRQGALITGLIGLSAGAGLSGLLLIYIAIQVLRFGRMGTERKF